MIISSRPSRPLTREEDEGGAQDRKIKECAMTDQEREQVLKMIESGKIRPKTG